jgi:DNA-binding NarL/FixJ family response regulator
MHRISLISHQSKDQDPWLLWALNVLAVNKHEVSCVQDLTVVDSEFKPTPDLFIFVSTRLEEAEFSEITQLIKHKGNVPLVVFTSNEGLLVLRRLFRMGVADVGQKVFETEYLLEAIDFVTNPRIT